MKIVEFLRKHRLQPMNINPSGDDDGYASQSLDINRSAPYKE
jgi:hypothetical protein